MSEAYMKLATRTDADILGNGHAEGRKQGLGFGSNDHGQPWSDVFGAWGGSATCVWVSQKARLAMAMCPAPWEDVKDEASPRPLAAAFIRRVLAAAGARARIGERWVGRFRLDLRVGDR